MTLLDVSYVDVNNYASDLFFFLFQLDDEDSILPHKLQAALEQVLEKRRELACEKEDLPNGDSAQTLLNFSCFHNNLSFKEKCKKIFYFYRNSLICNSNSRF